MQNVDEAVWGQFMGQSHKERRIYTVLENITTNALWPTLRNSRVFSPHFEVESWHAVELLE